MSATAVAAADKGVASRIEQVAGRHRHTCDIANPSSPQSTVAMVRFEEDHVDYLVLADTFVVLAPLDGGPQVVTDSREVDVRSDCSSPLRGLPGGTLEYERALRSVIDALRARRNQSGGYWIAKDDPHAAMQAVAALPGLSTRTQARDRRLVFYRLTGCCAGKGDRRTLS